jgi:hypothetical protein
MTNSLYAVPGAQFEQFDLRHSETTIAVGTNEGGPVVLIATSVAIGATLYMAPAEARKLARLLDNGATACERARANPQREVRDRVQDSLRFTRRPYDP